MLLDEASSELVFAAVAGEGAEFLVGRRFPADRGIAGWVAATGEAVIVDQVSASAVFARDVAESTGYVPESIMAAQIAHAGSCLGVLEVLDTSRQPRGSFADLDLLSLLAGQAAIALVATGVGQASAAPAGAWFGGIGSGAAGLGTGGVGAAGVGAGGVGAGGNGAVGVGAGGVGAGGVGTAPSPGQIEGAVEALIRQVDSWDPHAQLAACQMLRALAGFFGGTGA